MAERYDYLIVGAGLAGCVLARQLTDAGKNVLLIDKRPYVGGNVHTTDVDGIEVHEHGAHIFHTNNLAVWKYINRFARVNNFINTPIAVYKNKVYNLPINMNTFSQLYGVLHPDEAMKAISEDLTYYENPQNLEEHLLSTVGSKIYQTLLKGYTEKQWGHDCKELPISIMRRVPIRFTYNNSYYDQNWQGVPENGYSDFFEKLTDGIKIVFGVDYLKDKKGFNKLSDSIIYTGAADELFNYQLGKLEYRSLRFEHKFIKGISNLNGVAVTNYTDKDVPYTRVIEHKHFKGFGVDLKTGNTVITYEYPQKYDGFNIPYYPVCLNDNLALYQKYATMAKEQNYLLCGRIAEYKYYDMSDTIRSALELSEHLLKEGN